MTTHSELGVCHLLIPVASRIDRFSRLAQPASVALLCTKTTFVNLRRDTPTHETATRFEMAVTSSDFSPLSRVGGDNHSSFVQVVKCGGWTTRSAVDNWPKRSGLISVFRPLQLNGISICERLMHLQHGRKLATRWRRVKPQQNRAGDDALRSS